MPQAKDKQQFHFCSVSFCTFGMHYYRYLLLYQYFPPTHKLQPCFLVLFYQWFFFFLFSFFLFTEQPSPSDFVFDKDVSFISILGFEVQDNMPKYFVRLPQKNLSSVNSWNTASPENIPCWVFRESADQFTDVLTDILNIYLILRAFSVFHEVTIIIAVPIAHGQTLAFTLIITWDPFRYVSCPKGKR